MKTKDFIKLLQEADPSGEGHLRMYGGIPAFAEAKEGYWDGSYTYIDEDGNYVTSIEGYKVDIHSIDIDDFVEQHFDEGWEALKERFKFKLNGYANKSQRDERIDNVLKKAKEAFDEYDEIKTKLYESAKSQMIENARKGWTWFQNKDVDKDERPNMHVYYTWKIFDEKGKEQGSNIHMTESILKSGLWKKEDNNKMSGYYQWIFKKC